MKKIILTLALAVLSFLSLSAQDITGIWYGVLKVGAMELPMSFNIKKDGQQYTSTMSVPMQSVKDAPVESTTYRNDTLTFEIPQLVFVYKGRVESGSRIKGLFVQHGQTFSLDLGREKTYESATRPQTPQPPFPYTATDVTFRNESAGIKLAGTLTVPEEGENFPAVVLVSGSGSQNRDEELFEHKPFLVLANYLSRNGIAVLRFDDRGFAESEGDARTATTADFATDALAGIRYLKNRKEVNPDKIGVIGHSEGGIIAFMLAAKEKDVAFVVSLAGSTIKGDSILLLQSEAIGRGYGMTEEALAVARSLNKSVYDAVQSTDDAEELDEKLTAILGTSEQAKSQVRQMTNNWMRFFLKYDPSADIRNIHIPTLALFGGKDVQVLAEPNAESFKNNIPDTNKNAEVKVYPGKNHLFQNAVTGLSNEYQLIEETISTDVLQDIAGWIKKVTK